MSNVLEFKRPLSNDVDDSIVDTLNRINTQLAATIAENAAKKLRMEEERKKKNETVKRNYRLTPKQK
jgi:hypothetical protein